MRILGPAVEGPLSVPRPSLGQWRQNQPQKPKKQKIPIKFNKTIKSKIKMKKKEAQKQETSEIKLEEKTLSL